MEGKPDKIGTVYLKELTNIANNWRSVDTKITIQLIMRDQKNYTRKEKNCHFQGYCSCAYKHQINVAT